MITYFTGMVCIVPRWVSWNFARTYQEELLKHSEGARKKKIESPPVVGSISSSKVIEKVLEFDTANNRSPLFVYSDATPYVHDNGMFAFIRLVRSGNWKLHLTTLKQFTEYSSLPTTGSIILVWFYYILLRRLPWEHQIPKFFTKSSWMELGYQQE